MTNNKSKIIIGVVVLLLILGALFYWPRLGKKKIVTDVPCLAPGIPLQQHIHPELKIVVGDKPQPMPANVGLTGGCERALHTHDDTGIIHVESQDSREYTLGDFFSVWGEPLQRLGYRLEVKVDGQVSGELGNLKFKDKQKVELVYVDRKSVV